MLNAFNGSGQAVWLQGGIMWVLLLAEMNEEEEEEKREEEGSEAASAWREKFSFDRDEVKQEAKDEGDFAVLADTNVAVYSAAALEQGLVQQVERTLAEDAEAMHTAGVDSSKLRGLIVESPQSSFVKHGDMTPFEVLAESKKGVASAALKKIHFAPPKKVCFSSCAVTLKVFALHFQELLLQY
ncbi:unnamed protein product [Gongylonema pulchrum]|uniref:PIN_6 domain-containing protein n=1 Tax=Gongylonema pulchrum TaxID=637853 RepID=A0A183EF53_9BILA|nr:unnamed protein product [Gongylonema pulchrum]